MNKSEFAKELASRADLTGVQAQKVTDEFLALLTASIAKGERVAFLGFGTFSTSKRAARMGVNPRNPTQKVKIPARTAVKFTPGAPLKAAANSGKVAKRKVTTAVKKDVKKVTTAVKKDVKKVTTAVKKDVKKVTTVAKKVVAKAAPKKAAPKKAAPKTAAPKAAAPKKAAPKTAAPKTAAPKKAAPKKK